MAMTLPQQHPVVMSTSSIKNSSGSITSTLSTESPPFNPRGIMGVLGNGSSASSSPAPTNQSTGAEYSPISTNSSINNNNTSMVMSEGGNDSNFSLSASADVNVPEGGSHSNAIRCHTFKGVNGEALEIRNVWNENVEKEMATIRELIETHPYVAMDTEFPGVVARPVSESFAPDYHYKSLKCNVDLLKIIQLGLSFSDEKGNFAKGCPCWQFNFQFDLNDDMYAQDSIDLLIKSGISFDDHARRGIDPLHFGELLMVSGLVLDDRVKWVTYHSGYDFGYLLKILTTLELPDDEKTFFDTLKIYFPTLYDIKYMTSLCDGHYGGLQKLADDLDIPRIGPEHQAGSDSLLTMSTYFALAAKKFTKIVTTMPSSNGSAVETIDDSKYKNELYGLGSNHTAHKNRIQFAFNNHNHSTNNGTQNILSESVN